LTSLELVEKLLGAQDECTFIWTTRDGSATGTIVSYFAEDGQIWMTVLAGSKRARAIARDPRTSVVISGKGSDLGHARCATLRGTSALHSDADTRNWFFPRFAAAVLPDSERGAAGMIAMMNNEANLVVEFTPDRVIPYDAHDQMVAANRA
jgi:hypothetical protein